MSLIGRTSTKSSAPPAVPVQPSAVKPTAQNGTVDKAIGVPAAKAAAPVIPPPHIKAPVLPPTAPVTLPPPAAAPAADTTPSPVAALNKEMQGVQFRLADALKKMVTLETALAAYTAKDKLAEAQRDTLQSLRTELSIQYRETIQLNADHHLVVREKTNQQLALLDHLMTGMKRYETEAADPLPPPPPAKKKQKTGATVSFQLPLEKVVKAAQRNNKRKKLATKAAKPKAKAQQKKRKAEPVVESEEEEEEEDKPEAEEEEEEEESEDDTPAPAAPAATWEPPTTETRDEPEEEEQNGHAEATQDDITTLQAEDIEGLEMSA